VIDDEDPLPSITISDVSHAEGNSGTTNFVFSVDLSNPSRHAVSVNFTTVDGTATSPSDVRKPAVFPPAVRAGRNAPEVPVNGDTTVEPDETFSVVLSNAVNATIGDGTGVGTTATTTWHRPHVVRIDVDRARNRTDGNACEEGGGVRAAAVGLTKFTGANLVSLSSSGCELEDRS